MIQPAPGATLHRYDPWQAYRRALDRRSRKSGGETPHESFANLRTEQDVLDWSSRYGLLGLLPHRAVMIVLPPRFELGGFDPADDPFAVAMPTVYVRAGAGWYTEHEPEDIADGHQALIGRPVPPPEWLPSWMPPSVVLLRLEEPGLERLSVADGLGAFFPGVRAENRESYRYPRPLSDAFWKHYAEPVSAILHVSHTFRLSLEGMRARSESLRWHATALARMLEPVRLVIQGIATDSSVRPGLVSGSLLGLLAAMALDDLSAAHKVSVCSREGCGRLFISAAYQVRYCSSRCRTFVNMRKFRQARRHRRRREDEGE